MEKVLQFLKDLSKYNSKEWFHENKKRYEDSRNKILFITEVLINEIRRFDPEIPAMDPKDCMFRIFRDIRFSTDKTPYKTNFGSFIAKGGRKSMHAGYYFHIEPDKSFAGGGIYMPQPEPLKAIRSHIAEHGDEFIEIIWDENFKKIFPKMYDHKVKTTPKGFPKDHKYIELLRYKSYVFSTDLSDELLCSDSLIEKIVKAFNQLYRVNNFINNAVNKL